MTRLIENSIIICAYTEERWADLAKAVESALNQIPSPGEVILVIDHNAALYKRAKGCYPAINVIENSEQQGLSGARNSGIMAASGQIIAFLDDDALAETNWLTVMCQQFENPKVFGIGAKVDPLWKRIRPKWLPEEFYWVVGCSYRGLPEHAAKIRNPIGAGMALRRTVFESAGHFNTGIGRIGRIPLGCEETELCIRARQIWTDGIVFYEPEAVVHHAVTANRTTWRYFTSRCFAEGLSKAAVSRLVGAQDGLSSERSYTFRVLPQGVMKGIQDTFLRGDISGLSRAGAIILGLIVTTTGYAIGTLSKASLKTG